MSTAQYALPPTDISSVWQLRTPQSWYYSTIAYFFLMVFCMIAAQLDSRLLFDVSVWSKPFKFSLSLVAYFATLIWCWNYTTEHFRRTTRAKVLIAIPTTMALLEMVYITVQAGLGEASHFNLSTPYHAMMYSLMGFGAVCMVIAVAWLGIEIGISRGLREPLIVAIVLGLVLTFVLGGGFGGYLGSAGGHWVNAPATDANGTLLFNWTRQGGDLRVAHFFGMHAMQVIPVFALLLVKVSPRVLSKNMATACVVGFACAYTAWTTNTFFQAIQGQPFMAGL